MEWIVPALFVLATVVQWWLKNRPHSEDPPLPSSGGVDRSAPPREDAAPVDELGDLLEALGRRRHESPPPPVLPSFPTVVTPPPPSVQTKTPALPPLPTIPAFLQETPPLVLSMTQRSDEMKSKKHLRPANRPHGFLLPLNLRKAVVMSEILAPPLALR